MAALPHYPEFNYESEKKTSKWTKYVNRLRNYFTAYNIEDDKRQKAILLTFVGEEMNDLIDELSSEQTTPDKTKHTLISSSWLCKTTPTQKTTPSITDLYFKKNKNKNTPNIEDFYRELKEAAAMCHFTDKNGEIKSQQITDCLSEKVH